MKRLFAVTAAILFSGAAYATDLNPPPQYFAAPSIPWSGFYTGLSAGYAQGTNDSTVDVLGSTTDKSSGFIGGGYAGYDFAWHYLVLGLETDFSGTTIKSTNDYSGKVGTEPFAAEVTHKLNWLGTTRARIGFLPFNSLMVYGTGGVAYGSVEDTLSASVGSSSLNSSFATTDTNSMVKVGWAAGAGLEYAITPHLRARTEYLHYDLGVSDFVTASQAAVSVAHKGDLVRAGIAYRW